MEQKEIDNLYLRLKKEAELRGYKLNPDIEFTKNLVKGILVNQKRYGYWACPCRLASGVKKKDLDIICPCDYRDVDLNEYGACYCALYVKDKIPKIQIPERRNKMPEKNKVWKCKVCGYLCSREHPPDKCPICFADADRFEEFKFS